MKIPANQRDLWSLRPKATFREYIEEIIKTKTADKMRKDTCYFHPV